MRFFRSFLFILAVIIFSAGLFLFGKYTNSAEILGSYAVLKVDKNVDDNMILDLLDEGKYLFTGSVISESTQWVLLDEFNAVSVIPLNEYHRRILPFDPRNDGYADKLSSFFIHDDIRRFFIPLKNTNLVTLEKQLKNLLGDIPFSVSYYGIGKPYHLYFILFAAASACVFVIFLIKKQRGQFFVLLLLPVLFSLSFFGAWGIALSTLIFGFFIFMREPLNEFFYFAGLPSGNKKRLALFSGYVFEPYKSYLPVIIIFILSFCGIIFILNMRTLFLILIITISSALYFFFLCTISWYNSNHRRFRPLHILKRKSIENEFSLYMLPFIIASIISIFLTPNIPGNPMINDEIPYQIDINDYYNHLDYQMSFSVRQLGSLNGSYPDFSLDNEGLPDNASPNTDEYTDASLYPPFPLENLLSFISKVNSDGKIKPESLNIPFNNYFILFLIIFIIPLFNKNLWITHDDKNGLFSLKQNTWYGRTDISRKNHYYHNIKIKCVS
jgi:hypothetical protein